jgi:hypothetical protein
MRPKSPEKRARALCAAETRRAAGAWLGRIFRSCALMCAVACGAGKPPPPTPEATIIEFARALNTGKLEEAYALMSADYRQRMSLDAFKHQLSENPDETMEISNALGHVRGPAAQEAVLVYREDGELRLMRDGERWYITTNVVDFYDQSTPRAALRAFVRAMERKRYDVVMRLVPEADKEGISAERMAQAWSGDGREEVERLLSNLNSHLDNPIEVIGNHATMPYGDNMRVQFVREGKDWKIEDPE